MRKIGLTGGIASGKSTVARLLREQGIAVIDADQVARDVVEPGTAGLKAIVEAFGPEIVETPSGRLDRAQLRARITNDAEARKTLNAITHPRIRAAIASWLAEQAALGTAMAVVEAALLVETGSHALYPELLVVSCEPETQLKRLLSRDGTSETDAKALIATQLPLSEKEAVATAVIRNDGDLESLRAKVHDWLKRSPS